MNRPQHLAVSLAIGAGLFAWYALRGRHFSPIANGSLAVQFACWGGMALACLVVFAVCYLELRFGSPRHFAALVGVVVLAPRIELDALGDWMVADDFLYWYQPGARPFGLFYMTIAYGLFVAALVVAVILGRLAFATKGAVWPKHLARAAGVCAGGFLLYSLGSVYWRMAVTLAPPTVPTAQRGENPLEQALPLLDEFYELEYPDRGFVLAQSGFVSVPGEYPKGLNRHQPGDQMAVVYAKLVDQLQKPGWAPLDRLGPEPDPSRQAQKLVLYKLLAFMAVLDADVEQAQQRKDFDGAVPYALALSQLEDNLRRGGLIMHRNLGNTGLLHLASLRRDVSTANARHILASVRRFEREREPFDVTLQRERAWEEQELNWRSRFRRLRNEGVPILSSGFGTRSLIPLPMFREGEPASIVYQRLLAAELALRLFQEDHGHLPEQLDELVPNYLDAVPVDSFSDQPLVYQVTDGKCRLYTVWSNGLDDGGKTGKGNFDEFRAKLPVDYDLDTGVRVWLKAKADGYAKIAQDARVKASMLKAQMGGRTPTPPPQGD